MNLKRAIVLVNQRIFPSDDEGTNEAWDFIIAKLQERRKTVKAGTPVQLLQSEIDALAEQIESSARVGDVMQPLEIFRELRRISRLANVVTP